MSIHEPQNASAARPRQPPRPRRPIRTCASRDPPPLPAVYQLVVECTSERDQQALYRRMREEGRKCRVLTLSGGEW